MESKMKETLEEVAKRIYGSEPSKDVEYYAFIEGAKWQQEQLEKELNRFFLYFRDNGERLLGASIEQLVKSYLKSR